MNLSSRMPRVLVTLLAATALAASSAAQAPQFNIVKPSTTGIPGEEMRVMTFDPQGNLWVAGRWPFWGESGIARLPASQVPYQGLPGGGFDTGAWEVWSNVHHAIPSAYIGAIEFGANGSLWFSSGGGLTHFDPATSSFFTYNTTNSPLLLNSVGSLDMDSTGRLWMVNGNVSNS